MQEARREYYIFAFTSLQPSGTAKCSQGEPGEGSETHRGTADVTSAKTHNFHLVPLLLSQLGGSVLRDNLPLCSLICSAVRDRAPVVFETDTEQVRSGEGEEDICCGL